MTKRTDEEAADLVMKLLSQMAGRVSNILRDEARTRIRQSREQITYLKKAD